VQLAVMLRDCTLDWYTSLYVNNPPETTRTIAYVKKILINSFHKLSSEYQYMNEMIGMRQQPGDSI
jgi:hypothetical protein